MYDYFQPLKRNFVYLRGHVICSFYLLLILQINVFLSEFFAAGEGDKEEEGELEQVRC